MKTPVLSIFLLLLAVDAFAQGAAPFWEPLPGPPGPLGYEFLDSTMVYPLGGTVYIYDTATNSWLPANNAESKFVVSPNKSLDYDYVSLHNNVWVTASGGWRSYIDSLFFSADSTFQWHFVGTFGTHRAKKNGALPSIISLLETPSSHVVLVDDSGRIYITTDTFKTMDTARVPEPLSSLFNDGDTLYLESIHGNLYRSTDFGKDWRMLLTLHDTASDWHLGMAIKGKLWLLYEYELQLSPVVYSNVNLWYSLDKGNDWTPMVNPAPAASELPTIDGIDEEGRMYLTFHFGFDSSFRTDDSGKTWHKLSMPDHFLYSFYVQPNGSLYAGFYRSTDQGETWDTISGNGIACLPSDMISFHASTIVNTSSAIFLSNDNGQSWTKTPLAAPGYAGRLSLRPDSTGWLMAGTTVELNPNGSRRYLCWYQNVQVSGVGVITSGFHVWVEFLGKLQESTDTGCDYVSFAYDTLSPTPITQVIETAHDTILALSTSGIYRGYDVLIPFDTVTPEPGTGATPTGTLMKDSTGAVYVAMSDGKLFVTNDGANTWQAFPSPTDGTAPIISLAASPTGQLFAADSNLATGYTQTWEYVPAAHAWQNITKGLRRQGFPDTAEVTNIWYVNGYAYAGTWNMGLFRSVKPVGPTNSVATTEHYTPFRLYPNPASSFVTISFPPYIKCSGYQLFDLSGKEVLHGTIGPNATSARIDIRDIPDGIYEMKAIGGGWIPAKLMVQH